MARSIEAAPERNGAWGNEKGEAVPCSKPTSDESITSDDAGTVDEIVQDQPPALPFSKARCIALVATVAGASFLNVSSRVALEISCVVFGTDYLCRLYLAKQWSLSCQQSDGTWTYQILGCSGWYLRIILHSAASFCFGAALQTSTANARSSSGVLLG